MIPPEAESRLNGQPALGLAAGPQVQRVEEAIERVWPTRRNIHRRLRAICIRDGVGIGGRGPGVGPWFGIWDLGPWLGTYESDLLGLGVVPVATDDLACLF